MRIVTVEEGKIGLGAVVTTITLSGGFKIPAIVVGEEGRGSQRGVMSVKLLPDAYKTWERNGYVKITHGLLDKTKTGNHKLIQVETTSPWADSNDFLCVFRTHIGFRGSNSHTGDRCIEQPDPENLKFEEFPGITLITGCISQGAAGRMGSGEQLIAIMPKGTPFRTGYGGRLYGAPRAHYFLHTTDNQMFAMTWEERCFCDTF